MNVCNSCLMRTGVRVAPKSPLWLRPSFRECRGYNIWHIIGEKVRKRTTVNVSESWNTAEDEWKKITPELCNARNW